MLVLSRKVGEQVQIASDITLTILEIQGQRMKVGINAPAKYRVLRGELEGVNTAHFETVHAESQFAAISWLDLRDVAALTPMG